MGAGSGVIKSWTPHSLILKLLREEEKKKLLNGAARSVITLNAFR